MKNLVAISLLVFSASPSLAQTVQIGSVYTDLTKDCVEVELSNDKSEIDFSRSECKAFGGYRLEVSGGDLRYSPRLYWMDIEIDSETPGAFHDPGSDFVEWLYSKETYEDGQGSLTWIGFIYRLTVADPNDETGTKSVSKLYAVRLDQSRSCALGEVPGANNERAREMIVRSKANCR